MSEIGYGYGSEWHLMRYLAYHRSEFYRITKKTLGLKSLRVFDSKYNPLPKLLHDDVEWTNIDFIENEEVGLKWKGFWPSTGKPISWDAIGQGTDEIGECFVLFEAKAHANELQSDCGASGNSIEMIDKALNETKSELRINSNNDWKKKYYQLANRITTCVFLNKNGIRTYLVYIYFYGERPEKHLGKTCPSTKKEWMNFIEEEYKYLGIKHYQYMKALFLNIH